MDDQRDYAEEDANRAAVMAEMLSEEEERIIAKYLCRKCDVFIGYGAVGVVKMPNQPPEWLGSHCWMCGRSAAEIGLAAR